MKKPRWVIDKEQSKRAAAAETVWLFGLHAVRDALENPAREKLQLIVTRNAADKLGEAIAASGVEPEIVDPRRFTAPLDPQSVHQGAALEVKPLAWGSRISLTFALAKISYRVVEMPVRTKSLLTRRFGITVGTTTAVVATVLALFVVTIEPEAERFELLEEPVPFSIPQETSGGASPLATTAPGETTVARHRRSHGCNPARRCSSLG